MERKVEPRLLLNRIEPKKGESAYSYLFRLSEANHYKNLTWMFNDYIKFYPGRNYNYLEGTEWEEPVLNLLKKRVGIQNPELLFLNSYNNVIFDKEKVDKISKGIFYISTKTCYCPDCLKDNIYYPLIWDITFVTVCPKHKVHLLEKCNECGRDVFFGKLMKNTCVCGEKFSEQITKPIVHRNILESQMVLQNMLTLDSFYLQLNENEKVYPKEYFYLFNMFGLIIHGLPVHLFDTRGFSFEDGTLIQYSTIHQNRDGTMFSFITTIINCLIVKPQIYLPKILKYLNDIPRELKMFRTKRNRYFKNIMKHPKGSLYLDIYLKPKMDLLSLKKASSLLKLTPQTMDKLCQIDLLKKEQISKKRNIIRKHEFNRFIRLVFGNSKNHFSSDNIIPFKEAIRIFHSSINQVKIIQLIINNSLTTYLSGEKNFNNLYLNRDELRALKSEELIKEHKPLSLYTAAKILKMSQKKLFGLCASGELEYLKVIRKGKVVTLIPHHELTRIIQQVENECEIGQT